MKQATDGCSVLMCLQYCCVTTSNSVVNYQDIFSVKFCAQCEYSKTCKPICVICIWLCAVSIDPRLVILAKYAKKCPLFRLRQYGNPKTTWPKYEPQNVTGRCRCSGRERGGRRPPLFSTGGVPHSPHFFGLKFVQTLVHCCNWLVTETQCKIISVQQN